MTFCVKKERKVHFFTFSGAPFAVCFPPLYHLAPPQWAGFWQTLVSPRSFVGLTVRLSLFVNDLQISTSYEVPFSLSLLPH